MAKDTFANRGRIAVIGAGHMGTALVRGLRAYTRARIIVSDSSRENARAAKSADFIFIAVKPSVVRSVLSDIKHVTDGRLVVSLAAGVSVGAMKKILGRRSSVARMMPNIPVANGEGVVGLYADDLSTAQKATLRKVLNGLGLLVEVKKESDLDTITLISGCGPGIVSSFVALLTKEARTRGVSAERAEALALQIFKGTLTYLEKSGMTSHDLITAVATKGGVTEAILKELARGGFEKTFAHAMKRGHAKIKSIRT